MVTAPARERWIFPGLLLVVTVSGIVGSLGAPLIPEIARGEGVSLGTAQWALTVTMLVGAVGSPVVSRIGAGRRRRPVMLGTVAVVALGTLLAALPLGFPALVVGRALQGLAFSLSPLAFSVAREALPPERQRSAIAALSVANVASAGLGFPATALTASLAGVKGAFWLGLVLMVVALAVGLLSVPGSAQHVPGSVDWAGAALLGGGTLCLLLAISQADRWGYTSAPILLLFGGGLLLLAVCAAWLRRAAHPLVDLRVAARRGVVGAHVAALLAGCGMYMMMSLVMVLVQSPDGPGYGLGHSVVVAGLMLVPYAVASVAGNRFALWIGPRMGPDLLLPAGCLLFGLAQLLLLLLHAQLWQVGLVMLVGGIGSGMTFNSIPWLMLRFVPPEETGSAMSFNLVVRYLGFAVGSALSLAVVQGLADDAGHPTQAGFAVGAATGLGVSVLATVGCLVLARSAGRAAAEAAARGGVPAEAAQSADGVVPVDEALPEVAGDAARAQGASGR
ncbi:MFS transporter [Blastococcus sp. SYSU D00820]